MKRTLNTTINRSMGETDDEFYTQYADDFGRTISQSGSMTDFLRIRFSTKYFDSETGLYYYLMRFYRPPNRRWLNRDPIEESGGKNLYIFCGNNAMGSPINIGYFNAPVGDNNPRQDEFHFQLQYVPIEGKGTYNDCVMREAVKNVRPQPYNMWTWSGRSTGQYNCQDYADDLRAEYYKLLLDLKTRCKCNLK